MYAVEKQQFALNGSSDQWRRPPRRVSIRKGVPLLEKVPGRHVLEVKRVRERLHRERDERAVG